MIKVLLNCTCIALVLVTSSVFAQRMVSLTATPTTVNANEKVTFTLLLEMTSETGWCGLSINTGDGGRIRDRVGDKGRTVVRDHVYKTPGRYLVVAEGEFLSRGLKSAPPCLGTAIAIEIQVIESLEVIRQRETALKEKELEEGRKRDAALKEKDLEEKRKLEASLREKERLVKELELKLKAEALARELEEARDRESKAKIELELRLKAEALAKEVEEARIRESKGKEDARRSEKAVRDAANRRSGEPSSSRPPTDPVKATTVPPSKIEGF